MEEDTLINKEEATHLNFLTKSKYRLIFQEFKNLDKINNPEINEKNKGRKKKKHEENSRSKKTKLS